MLGYLLPADLERFLLALLVYLGNAQIVARCKAHDRAQRLDDRIVLDLVITAAAIGYLKPLAGLDNDLLACFYALTVRGKIIAFTPVFEFYAYNLSQLFSSFPLPSALPAAPKCVSRPY